jgi:hypothetical protein
MIISRILIFDYLIQVPVNSYNRKKRQMPNFDANGSPVNWGVGIIPAVGDVFVGIALNTAAIASYTSYVLNSITDLAMNIFTGDGPNLDGSQIASS